MVKLSGLVSTCGVGLSITYGVDIYDTYSPVANINFDLCLPSIVLSLWYDYTTI